MDFAGRSGVRRLPVFTLVRPPGVLEPLLMRPAPLREEFADMLPPRPCARLRSRLGSWRLDLSTFTLCLGLRWLCRPREPLRLVLRLSRDRLRLRSCFLARGACFGLARGVLELLRERLPTCCLRLPNLSRLPPEEALAPGDRPRLGVDREVDLLVELLGLRVLFLRRSDLPFSASRPREESVKPSLLSGVI